MPYVQFELNRPFSTTVGHLSKLYRISEMHRIGWNRWVREKSEARRYPSATLSEYPKSAAHKDNAPVLRVPPLSVSLPRKAATRKMGSVAALPFLSLARLNFLSLQIAPNERHRILRARNGKLGRTQSYRRRCRRHCFPLGRQSDSGPR